MVAGIATVIIAVPMFFLPKKLKSRTQLSSGVNANNTTSEQSYHRDWKSKFIHITISCVVKNVIKTI